MFNNQPDMLGRWAGDDSPSPKFQWTFWHGRDASSADGVDPRKATVPKATAETIIQHC